MAAKLTIRGFLGAAIGSLMLGAIAQLRRDAGLSGGSPFSIICGTSAGAINAALFAASLVAHGDASVRRAWKQFRTAQTAKVLQAKLP